MLSKLFKKKPKLCFFCKVNLQKNETAKLQYSSADGLHTVDLCDECSKTFDNLADTIEELRDGRETNTI